MGTEKVSVIIPVYNSEKFIGKCLRSVLEQTYTDLKVIVINDGSEDASAQIARRMADEDGRITVIDQERQGVSAARNKGVLAAKGKYMAFLDSDDYLGKTYIEGLVNRAEECNADIVISGFTLVQQSSGRKKRVVPDKYERGRYEEWSYRISSTGGRFYKREFWDKYRLCFPVGVRAEDVPITFFCNGMSERICILRDAQYYYVQHKNSAMHTFKGLKDFQLPYTQLEKLFQYFQDRGMKNSRECFEMGVLRLFTMFVFYFGRGADRSRIKELCNYVERNLKKYFPYYDKNRYLRMDKDNLFTKGSTLCVCFFVFLMKTNLLYRGALINAKIFGGGK